MCRGLASRVDSVSRVVHKVSSRVFPELVDNFSVQTNADQAHIAAETLRTKGSLPSFLILSEQRLLEVNSHSVGPAPSRIIPAHYSVADRVLRPVLRPDSALSDARNHHA